MNYRQHFNALERFRPKKLGLCEPAGLNVGLFLFILCRSLALA